MRGQIKSVSRDAGSRSKVAVYSDNPRVDAVGACILCILNYALSGDANDVFWTLFAFSSIVFMLCYVIEFIAAVKLKFADNTPRVYEVPGGKFGMVVCAILCEASVLLAILGLLDLDVTGYGFWMQTIGLILTFVVGVVLYYSGKKKAQ